jgi:hypothetical protein
MVRARSIAMLFVVLVASPCTEPFSICSPAVLLSAPGTHVAVVPSRMPSVAAVFHDESGYPPLSLTDDQLKDSKDVTTPQVLSAAAPRSGARPVVITSPLVPGALQAAPAVLRI